MFNIQLFLVGAGLILTYEGEALHVRPDAADFTETLADLPPELHWIRDRREGDVSIITGLRGMLRLTERTDSDSPATGLPPPLW